MAIQQHIICISEEAGADLSGLQFHFVSMSSDGQVDGSGNGAQVIGVLQNAPDTAGLACEIAVYGVAKVTAGGSVTAGDLVASDANSEAVVAATGDKVAGIAMTSADSGDVFPVLLHAGGDTVV